MTRLKNLLKNALAVLVVMAFTFNPIAVFAIQEEVVDEGITVTYKFVGFDENFQEEVLHEDVVVENNDGYLDVKHFEGYKFHGVVNYNINTPTDFEGSTGTATYGYLYVKTLNLADSYVRAESHIASEREALLESDEDYDEKLGFIRLNEAFIAQTAPYLTEEHLPPSVYETQADKLDFGLVLNNVRTFVINEYYFTVDSLPAYEAGVVIPNYNDIDIDDVRIPDFSEDVNPELEAAQEAVRNAKTQDDVDKARVLLLALEGRVIPEELVLLNKALDKIEAGLKEDVVEQTAFERLTELVNNAKTIEDVIAARALIDELEEELTIDEVISLKFKLTIIEDSLVQEEVEVEAPSFITNEDESVKIQALEDGAIPKGAKLSVGNITKTVDKDLLNIYNNSVKDLLNGKVILELLNINIEVDGVAVQPSGAVNVTITISDKFEDLEIVYIDSDGKVTSIDSIVSADGKTISFETDHFSNYAVVGKDVEADTNTDVEEDTNTDVKEDTNTDVKADTNTDVKEDNTHKPINTGIANSYTLYSSLIGLSTVALAVLKKRY